MRRRRFGNIGMAASEAIIRRPTTMSNTLSDRGARVILSAAVFICVRYVFVGWFCAWQVNVGTGRVKRYVFITSMCAQTITSYANKQTVQTYENTITRWLINRICHIRTANSTSKYMHMHTNCTTTIRCRNDSWQYPVVMVGVVRPNNRSLNNTFFLCREAVSENNTKRE